jgi:hypothetical protein
VLAHEIGMIPDRYPFDPEKHSVGPRCWLTFR